MSKVFLMFVLFATLTAFVMAHARPEGEQQRHRAKREDIPMDDLDMMQRIFRTPIKRQWCRVGWAYNPALGTCTPSLRFLTGQARSSRRN